MGGWAGIGNVGLNLACASAAAAPARRIPPDRVRALTPVFDGIRAFTPAFHGLWPSIAHALIGRGLAQVGARSDDPACGARLSSRARVAPTRTLGLRGEPDYAIINGETGALPEPMAHLPVVAGKVTSVRGSGGMIYGGMIYGGMIYGGMIYGGMIYGGMTYIDFGGRRLQAPTVTILKRREWSPAAAGLRADRLANLELRVRGYVEERSGPRIEATRPEEIEIAEGK
jgi:micrococcal nuclease